MEYTARLREVTGLRLKDLDFSQRTIMVRLGRGGKDPVVTMPDELRVPLRRHLERRQRNHRRDRERGIAGVWLPHALARKYPNASWQLVWQYLFAASRPGAVPRSGVVRTTQIYTHVIQCGGFAVVSPLTAALAREGHVRPE